MKKSAKKMKSATKVEAAFLPLRKLSKKKSSKNLKKFVRLVQAAPPRKPLKKEKAAAVNEKMKAEESVSPQSRLFKKHPTFRAEICGFDTGADAEKVNKALRKHFEGCGWIQKIEVNDEYACIAFASLDTLFKALELNNTTVDGYPITVQPEVQFHTSRFRADISWPQDIDVEDLRPYFENCGGIVGIRYYSFHNAARIDFTNLDSLNKALKLNNIPIDGNHTITVKKCKFFPCAGIRRGGSGYCGGGRRGGSGYRRSGMKSI